MMNSKILPVAAAAFAIFGFAQTGEAQFRPPGSLPSGQISGSRPGGISEGHAPDSRRMVEILKGGSRPGASARVAGRGYPVEQRRIVPAAEALPKGMAGLAMGERVDSAVCYRVDPSSRLATTKVKFLKASTRLDGSDSYYFLQQLAEALRDPCFTGSRFVIEGHASADGSDYTNLVLAQRRANAIVDYLVSVGVNPRMLVAVGHGETQARYPEHAPEYLLAEDRQVMVYRLAD